MCLLVVLATGWMELILSLTKTILWSDGEAVRGLSGWTAGQMIGTGQYLILELQVWISCMWAWSPAASVWGGCQG